MDPGDICTLMAGFLDDKTTLDAISRVVREVGVASQLAAGRRVDTKWRFQFFAKYDYRFLLDVIIAIIATFFAKAIIVISRLSLSISLE
jgi:hypothetical protein